MSKTKININLGIRLPKYDKRYYQAQIEEFVSQFNSNKVLSISFGKQDIRGTESITITDHNYCVPKQKHFTNKWEMLGYIVGFNSANGGYYSDFYNFLNNGSN